MRPLHIISTSEGGAALSTIELIEAMKSLGVRSAAVCGPSGERSVRARLTDAVDGALLTSHLYWWNKKTRASWYKRPAIDVLLGSRSGWGLTSSSRVIEFARKVGADIFHTSTSMHLEGGLASRRTGLPHVWHIRELVGRGQPYEYPVAGRMLGRIFEGLSDVLIANSHVTHSVLQPYVKRNVRLIQNGLNLSGFTHTPSRSVVRVGMVASLKSRSKRHDLFIQAAARLRHRRPDISFRIYGGGDKNDGYVKELRSLMAAHELDPEAMLAGYVNDPRQIMSEIDLLVHPSSIESFGRIAVEAMAASLPVVGIRQGGLAEVVEDQRTGILVAPNDPSAIAEAVERLAGNEELRTSMGRAGRARACELFSIERHAERIVEVYESVRS